MSLHVLVALDDDSLFEAVVQTLRWCIRLGPHDQVTLFHARAPRPWAPEDDAEWADDLRAAAARIGQLRVAAERRLSAWGLRSAFLESEGSAAAAILHAAEERKADLVVLGVRGRSERGFLIGSVSEKVKALARTDVLLVRPPAPLEGERFRALLAVDGSPEGLLAVRAFVEKLRSEDASVCLLHALDLPFTVWDAFGEVDPVDPANLPAGLRARAEDALGPARAVLAERGIEPVTEIRRGRAAEEILHAAGRHHAHLVAMGSRGLSGLRALLVGSVTRRTVHHGSASVLVARAPHA